MNVVDSSAWLEYFANSSNAEFFARPIQDVAGLIVPSITLYEVFKRVLQQKSATEALQAVAHMKQGLVVDLGADLAVAAAGLSATLKLPLADAIILATARERSATLWTQDAHFEGLAGVKYRPKC